MRAVWKGVGGAKDAIWVGAGPGTQKMIYRLPTIHTLTQNVVSLARQI